MDLQLKQTQASTVIELTEICEPERALQRPELLLRNYDGGSALLRRKGSRMLD